MNDDIIHDIGSAEDETNEFYHKWLDRKAEVKDLSLKLEIAHSRIAELEAAHRAVLRAMLNTPAETVTEAAITPESLKATVGPKD